MAERFFLPRQFVVDGNGQPRAGAKLFFYDTGTTTPRATFSDSGLSVPNTNPVVADSAGTFGDIFLSPVSYKVILKDAADVTIWTADPVTPPISPAEASQAQADARTASTVYLSPRRLATGLGLEGAAVASGATIAIPDIGDIFQVTGATSIGGVTFTTARDGREFELYFAGAPALTHHATDFILPGAANIAAAAGDCARFRRIGAGNKVRCTRYTRFSGASVVSSGLRSYLAGYGLANNAGDATNDVDIAAGFARSWDNAGDIILASALTKRLDAAWAAGSGSGGRDVGSIADGTWHVHAIKRTDTDVEDALFSLTAEGAATITVTIASPAVVTWTGHGLVAGAGVVFTTTGALPTGIVAGTLYYVLSSGLTADAFQFSAAQGGGAINTSGTQSGVHTGTASPTMPASYTLRRRIGAVIRSGGAIVAFVQTGDWFWQSVPLLDVDATNPGTAAVTRTLSVPTGVVVIPLLSAHAPGTGTAFLLTALDQADTAAAINTMFSVSSGSGSGAGVPPVKTNRSAQIRSRASTSGSGERYNILTHGWIDQRGRDA